MRSQILFILLCAIWGTTWVAVKLGLDGVAPFRAAAIRFLAAAAIQAALLGARGRLSMPSRGDVPVLFSAGLLGIGFHYSLIYWGMQHLASGAVAALCATTPLLVGLCSMAANSDEKATVAYIYGSLMCLGGLFLLYTPGGTGAAGSLKGTLAIVGAAAAAASNMLFVRARGRKTDPELVNFYSFILGGVVLAAASLSFESGRETVWKASSVGALVYLTLIGTNGAFAIFYKLLQHWTAHSVGTVFLIVPVLAVYFGAAVLGEPLGMASYLGTASVALGLWATRARGAGMRRLLRPALAVALILLIATPAYSTQRNIDLVIGWKKPAVSSEPLGNMRWGVARIPGEPMMGGLGYRRTWSEGYWVEVFAMKGYVWHSFHFKMAWRF